MKYKTLFRMLLKVIGVWVVVNGISALLSQAGMIGYYFTNAAVRGSGQWFFLFNVIGPLVQLGLGAYLFLDGKWVADKAIPGNRSYCHECGYDLTNAAGNLCSECGTPFKPAAEMSSAP